MIPQSEKIADAIQVARMYYYQNLTTESIARELDVSRSKVSRLLSYAKDQGIVEVRIHDPRERSQRIEDTLIERFGLYDVKVVSVPDDLDEPTCLQRVGLFAAKYLNTLIQSDMTLALAWGTTVSVISHYLTPRRVVNVDVVQLNGSGNTQNMSNTYAGEIIMRFAKNYEAQAHLFPVPTFFDYPQTKSALWRERSIQRIVRLQKQADILLYSIGAINAGVPSHVYSGGYLEHDDLQDIDAQNVVGDIATVMFREDGSYQNIPINARASGPPLDLFKDAPCSLCVVSGRSKARGLQAALRGGFINHLVVDEPTARYLLDSLD
jgi:DNA-binding transcriptional regulator LsrR (DeoR family)